MSAVDIIAVRQPDGTIKSSSFYVLFDSRKASETIQIEVNGKLCPHQMTASKNGDIGFCDSPIVDTKRGPIDIVTFEHLIEKDLAQQEGEGEEDMHNKIKEEEREIRKELEEEHAMFKHTRSGSISNNSSTDSITSTNSGPPSRSSSFGDEVKPLSAIPLSLSMDSPTKVQKNGSYSGSPSTVNKDEKNGDSKTPTRNRSLNSLLSPLLSSFRKNGNNGNNKNGEKSPEKKDKNNEKKNEQHKKKENTQEIVLTKTPNSEQLNSMDLKEGENVIKFIAKQSKQVAEAKLFLWNYDSKVIVSDIDGTITKTDKRGLFLYKFGYDWTHEKVVDLYKCLHGAGYKFVYLTARTVKGQLATRTYLEKIGTPNGPILSAPHDFFGCVKTEYWKQTADNKLSHLKPLKKLFPENTSAIVAGFGNRVHDHVCYTAIEIPPERIYIINKYSEITVNGLKTKYETLLQIASSLFPPVNCLTAS